MSNHSEETPSPVAHQTRSQVAATAALAAGQIIRPVADNNDLDEESTPAPLASENIIAQQRGVIEQNEQTLAELRAELEEARSRLALEIAGRASDVIGAQQEMDRIYEDGHEGQQEEDDEESIRPSRVATPISPHSQKNNRREDQKVPGVAPLAEEDDFSQDDPFPVPHIPTMFDRTQQRYQAPSLRRSRTPLPFVSGHQPEAPTFRIPSVKAPLPEKWGGSPKDLRQWIGKVKLYIHLQGSALWDPKQQVHLAASLLKDTAWNWIEPYYSMAEATQPRWMRSLELLFAEIQRVFGEPDIERSALRSLEKTKQTSSVGKYIAEFSQWSTLLPAYGDAPMRDQFYKGLKDSVKDELARHEKWDTLEELKVISVRLDNRLFERRIEKNGEPFRDGKTDKMGTPSNKKPNNFFGNRNRNTQQSNHLNAVDISPEEKKRRQEGNLCYNCGAAGHVSRNCEKDSNRQGRNSKPNWREKPKKENLNATTSTHHTDVDEDADDSRSDTSSLK